MALTKPNVTVPKGVWTNLYTLAGIAVGTAVTVYNRSNTALLLATTTLAPSGDIGIPCQPNDKFAIGAAEAGLWGYSDDSIKISLQL